MTATADVTPDVAPRHRATAGLAITWLLCVAGLLVVCFLSITFGARGVDLGTIIDAFTDVDPDSAAQGVIRELRVPRTLIGLLAGAALGLGGTVLQGVTRNPLGDPGIMGINAGAALFIVTGIAVLGTQQVSAYIWLAFAGAGTATAIVYGIASLGREGATPVKLALAGAAVTAIASSITSGIILTNVDALNELRFWQVGALAGRAGPELRQTAPFLVVGIVIALFTGRALNGLSLGEDLAVALGLDVRRTRTLLLFTIALLCGAATAAIGPIVFVGLVVPHVARVICGPDYRWILAFSAVLAPSILLLADIVGRLVVSPSELQVGVVLGVLGAPAFIALVRFRNLAEL